MIDVNTAFANVFSRNIVCVSFGSDVSDLQFDLWDETAQGSNIFEMRKFTFAKAIGKL